MFGKLFVVIQPPSVPVQQVVSQIVVNHDSWFFSSGDDDDDEDSAMQEARDKKRQEEEESLFQRLEESRLMLEQELGIDRFLRVYKFLQVQRCV